MTTFHAVMRDETGCEFAATVSTRNRSAAYARLRDEYPESRCIQLESPGDTARRERHMYARLNREYDYDY